MFGRWRKRAAGKPLAPVPARPEDRAQWVEDRRAEVLHAHLDAADPRLNDLLSAAPAATPAPAQRWAPDPYGPTPDGWVRGVAHVLERSGSGGADANVRVHQAVLRLSISVPGREPYEVRKQLIWRKGRATANGLPVLVDVEDRERVRILWDEIPAGADNAAILGEVERRMQAAVDGAFGPPSALEQTMAAHQAVAVQAAWQHAIDACTDPQQRAQVEAMARAGGWRPPS